MSKGLGGTTSVINEAGGGEHAAAKSYGAITGVPLKLEAAEQLQSVAARAAHVTRICAAHQFYREVGKAWSSELRSLPKWQRFGW